MEKEKKLFNLVYRINECSIDQVHIVKFSELTMDGEDCFLVNCIGYGKFIIERYIESENFETGFCKLGYRFIQTEGAEGITIDQAIEIINGVESDIKQNSLFTR